MIPSNVSQRPVERTLPAGGKGAAETHHRLAYRVLPGVWVLLCLWTLCTGSEPARADRSGDTFVESLHYSLGHPKNGLMIALSGPVTYPAESIAREPRSDRPARFYVDLSSARLDLRVPSRLQLDGVDGRRVRASQFSDSMVRVVLDLERQQAYRVDVLTDPNYLVLRPERAARGDLRATPRAVAELREARPPANGPTQVRSGPTVSESSTTDRDPGSSPSAPVERTGQPVRAGSDRAAPQDPTGAEPDQLAGQREALQPPTAGIRKPPDGRLGPADKAALPAQDEKPFPAVEAPGFRRPVREGGTTDSAERGHPMPASAIGHTRLDEAAYSGIRRHRELESVRSGVAHAPRSISSLQQSVQSLRTLSRLIAGATLACLLAMLALAAFYLRAVRRDTQLRTQSAQALHTSIEARHAELTASLERQLAESVSQAAQAATDQRDQLLTTIERQFTERIDQMRQLVGSRLQPLETEAARLRCDALELEARAALRSGRPDVALDLYRRMVQLVANSSLAWRIPRYLSGVRTALVALRDGYVDLEPGSLTAGQLNELAATLADIPERYLSGADDLLDTLARIRGMTLRHPDPPAT